MSLFNSIRKLTSGSRTDGEDTKMKFSLAPGGETGFSQWLDAMKMVAQLPGGMPPEFRTKLWLQLSEKHLNDQNIDWEKAEAVIFNEWTNPDDEELGVQIVKDLHRTGCSLFCGAQEHNQALLKRVLLAYARWNKSVGYCQGFNMLAALILQVMDRDEKNAVKVMIYLIEGVLPESYFANNLRGLSVDMAVFRDLLRLRLPKLSKHLEALQHDTNSGSSYEPPLTNVFTMQWFLTLFSNCLPQQTVLRVWDLVFLHGNEVLLRTALAIWGILQDRIITVESADEFYSIMGVVTREMLEFGLMDANNLVKMIVMVDPFPNELQELREKYLYNISPWTQSVQSAAKKGIKLFYSDPEDQDDTEDEDKIALATAYGVFRRRESTSRELQPTGPTLDISVLKQQYAKLRQRQRQAHIIISAACSSNLTGNIASAPSVSVNHLLMGKSALVNKGRRIGPPEGAIPPPNNKNKGPESAKKSKVVISGETLHWKDADTKKCSKVQMKNKSNTEHKVISNKANHCNGGQNIWTKDEDRLKTNHDRIEYEEDDFVSEKTVEDSLRKKELKKHRSSSSSSSSTELCDDEFHRYSDFDSEEATNSDASGYNVKEKKKKSDMMKFGTQFSDSIKEVRILTENLTTDVKTEEEENEERRTGNKIKISKSSSEMLEIKNCAMDLINEIEGRLQNSEKLKFLSFEDNNPDNLDVINKVSAEENVKVSLKTSNNDNMTITPLFDNNTIDNILKLEPEVPISENNVIPDFISQTVEEVEIKTDMPEEVERVDKNRRKSELATSVIKENLEMLHKFTVRSAVEIQKEEEERARREEEERKEEERVRREEEAKKEERTRREEEKIRKEERARREEERARKEERERREERARKEDRIRKEQEERVKKEEEERVIKEEEERVRKVKEEQIKKDEKERVRKEEEKERVLMEEERAREEKEELARKEEEEERIRKEEEKLRKEEERIRHEEERIRKEEERIRKEKERIKREEERIKKEKEEKLTREKDKINKVEEEKKKKEKETLEKREEERKKKEKERMKKEEEISRKKEEEIKRKEEIKIKEERLKKREEERKKKEDEERKKKEEERKKKDEERVKKEEERSKKKDEERIKREEETMKKEKEERLRKKRDEERKNKEEEERKKKEEERLKREEERTKKEETLKRKEEERKKKEDEERVRKEEEKIKKEEKVRQEEEKIKKKERLKKTKEAKEEDETTSRHKETPEKFTTKDVIEEKILSEISQFEELHEPVKKSPKIEPSLKLNTPDKLSPVDTLNKNLDLKFSQRFTSPEKSYLEKLSPIDTRKKKEGISLLSPLSPVKPPIIQEPSDIKFSPGKTKLRYDDFSYASKSPERIRMDTSPLRRTDPEGIERDLFSEIKEITARSKKESETLKSKIELSKSDWEMKMRKIAELENTTRVKLIEMQTRSEGFRRRTGHRSLDRADGEHRRICSDILENDESRYAGTYTPRRGRTRSPNYLIEPSISKSELPEESTSDTRRKLRTSALSFDEITSRTEKLLKTSEHKSIDDKYFRSKISPISPEFETYKKPKDPVLKFKQLLEESYGADEEETKYEYQPRKYQFYSSPTSPEYSSRIRTKYSEYVSPKKYSPSSDSSARSKYQDENDDWLRITQDTSNKSKIELIEEKYSPISEYRKSTDTFGTSFNPFPTRSPLRPKELGVKLGMYPNTNDQYWSKKS